MGLNLLEAGTKMPRGGLSLAGAEAWTSVSVKSVARVFGGAASCWISFSSDGPTTSFQSLPPTLMD